MLHTAIHMEWIVALSHVKMYTYIICIVQTGARGGDLYTYLCCHGIAIGIAGPGASRLWTWKLVKFNYSSKKLCTGRKQLLQVVQLLSLPQ